MEKMIKLRTKYSLDLSGSLPVNVETICFTENGVQCKYLDSYAGRIEELSYELFKMNGYSKPFKDDGPHTGADPHLVMHTGGTEICVSNEDASAHTLKSNFDSNNIIFYAGQGNEMMRITPEGFYWKGKLVENDKDIYLKVKEFFNTPPRHE